MVQKAQEKMYLILREGLEIGLGGKFRISQSTKVQDQGGSDV
jgi:hypothetical protein